jgi:hypothetical protein
MATRNGAYSLKRDGSDPLEFHCRRVAELVWPWSENPYKDTDIICRMQIFETETGKLIAGQCRYNLQVMIRHPDASPVEIYHDAREFGSLQNALDWPEKGQLGR